MKNQAIVIRKYGGPIVLKLENTEIDEPGRNEIFFAPINQIKNWFFFQGKTATFS